MNTVSSSPALTLYGIAHCDTVKKARAWLTARGVAHRFHDFRRDGVPEALPAWAEALGWQLLLNRRGTSWRALPQPARDAVHDAASACAVMRQTPATIKRPVGAWPDGTLSVGFDPEAWAARC